MIKVSDLEKKISFDTSPIAKDIIAQEGDKTYMFKCKMDNLYYNGQDANLIFDVSIEKVQVEKKVGEKLLEKKESEVDVWYIRLPDSNNWVFKLEKESKHDLHLKFNRLANEKNIYLTKTLINNLIDYEALKKRTKDASDSYKFIVGQDDS